MSKQGKKECGRKNGQKVLDKRQREENEKEVKKTK